MLIYCHYLRGGTGLQAQLPRPNGDKSEQYRTRRRVTDLIPVHVSEPQFIRTAAAAITPVQRPHT